MLGGGERSAVGRMLRGDAEGWSVDGQGVLGRGQEVTRVRVCIIRGSLPRVYTLLVFDVVRLARACDAPHSAEKKRARERNGMKSAVGVRRGPFSAG